MTGCEEVSVRQSARFFLQKRPVSEAEGPDRPSRHPAGDVAAAACSVAAAVLLTAAPAMAGVVLEQPQLKKVGGGGGAAPGSAPATR
jgi:hypothetical protein